MVRLYVFAEGQTEQAFASQVLRPHLAGFQVYLMNPVLIAHARKRGVAHRGGGQKFVAMQNDILRLLKQESGADVFFTTMVDLYSLPTDFPGREAAERLRNDPLLRVEELERAWAGATADPRFISFLQLHEYEAYLFSDPDEFAAQFEKADRGVEALKRIVSEFVSPELIDDGEQTAPSKRIEKHFPGYGKTTDGVQIAERIGLSTIREKCPHFHAWVARLEQLAASPLDR